MFLFVVVFMLLGFHLFKWRFICALEGKDVVGVVTRSCRPFITGTRCHFPFWDYLIIKAVPLILCDGSIMTWWQRWQQRLISPNYGTLQATTKPLFGRHNPR